MKGQEVKRFVFWIIPFVATQVAAETVEIEMNDGAALIRCIDQYGMAECQMVFESSDKFYECIAFDAENKPIATGIGRGGKTMFEKLDYSLIKDVKCR